VICLKAEHHEMDKVHSREMAVVPVMEEKLNQSPVTVVSSRADDHQQERQARAQLQTIET
jgi:hypothetical protein